MIKDKLLKLKVNKSPVPDGIHPRIIKMQLDVDVSPPANIISLTLKFTYVAMIFYQVTFGLV